MTINVQIKTVADTVSGYSVSGVNMFDIDSVPLNAIDSCPAFFPVPNGFVTDIQFTPQTLGGDSARKLDLAYTLNYRFLYAPIGSGSPLDNYAGLITKLELILEAILGNSSPTGAIDMVLLSVSDIGAMTDLAGANQYHGVDIALRVLEYAQ